MRDTQRGVAEMLRNPRPIGGGDGTTEEVLSEADAVRIADQLLGKMRKAARKQGGGNVQRPAIYSRGAAAAQHEHASLGEAFVDSDAYRG